MNYVISDIHGCCREFEALLKKINFSINDTLYVIGDMVDRGPDPMGVLKIMASNSNIYPVAGNHEFIMMSVLPRLMQDIKEDNITSVLTGDFLRKYSLWMGDGGNTTINEFKNLSREEQDFYLEYLGEIPLYEVVYLNRRKIVLIHSLPHDFDAKKDLNYLAEEILFGRPNFTKDWTQETVYIIGHTPTFIIPDAVPGKIYCRNNLIDIDCGCVTGYCLCAYCLETGEAFYEWHK